ncbi:hypothetical protein [Dolichospermum sp. UHCC 0259]|uniref:hypothetical protein n=1 Tax=Dolichospermum sp. UHCC 0259 TaxID=2590010 RepID=UPI001444E5AD|nr:hypothetical protein [Dolichospermum sp. UHCC 0259]
MPTVSEAMAQAHAVFNYKISYFGSMTASPLEIRLQDIDQIWLVMRSRTQEQPAKS